MSSVIELSDGLRDTPTVESVISNFSNGMISVRAEHAFKIPINHGHASGRLKDLTGRVVLETLPPSPSKTHALRQNLSKFCFHEQFMPKFVDLLPVAAKQRYSVVLIAPSGRELAKVRELQAGEGQHHNFQIIVVRPLLNCDAERRKQLPEIGRESVLDCGSEGMAPMEWHHPISAMDAELHIETTFRGFLLGWGELRKKDSRIAKPALIASVNVAYHIRDTDRAYAFALFKEIFFIEQLDMPLLLRDYTTFASRRGTYAFDHFFEEYGYHLSIDEQRNVVYTPTDDNVNFERAYPQSLADWCALYCVADTSGGHFTRSYYPGYGEATVVVSSPVQRGRAKVFQPGLGDSITYIPDVHAHTYCASRRYAAAVPISVNLLNRLVKLVDQQSDDVKTRVKTAQEVVSLRSSIARITDPGITTEFLSMSEREKSVVVGYVALAVRRGFTRTVAAVDAVETDHARTLAVETRIFRMLDGLRSVVEKALPITLRKQMVWDERQLSELRVPDTISINCGAYRGPDYSHKFFFTNGNDEPQKGRSRLLFQGLMPRTLEDLADFCKTYGGLISCERFTHYALVELDSWSRTMKIYRKADEELKCYTTVVGPGPLTFLPRGSIQVMGPAYCGRTLPAGLFFKSPRGFESDWQVEVPVGLIKDSPLNCAFEAFKAWANEGVDVNDAREFATEILTFSDRHGLPVIIRDRENEVIMQHVPLDVRPGKALLHIFEFSKSHVKLYGANVIVSTERVEHYDHGFALPEQKSESIFDILKSNYITNAARFKENVCLPGASTFGLRDTEIECAVRKLRDWATALCFKGDKDEGLLAFHRKVADVLFALEEEDFSFNVDAFLINGYPGTGKTFTFEQMARHTANLSALYVAPTRPRVDEWNAIEGQKVVGMTFEKALVDMPPCVDLLFIDEMYLTGCHWALPLIAQARRRGGRCAVMFVGDGYQVHRHYPDEVDLGALDACVAERMTALESVYLKVTYRFGPDHSARLQPSFPGICSASDGVVDYKEFDDLGALNMALNDVDNVQRISVTNAYATYRGATTATRTQGGTYPNIAVICDDGSQDVPAVACPDGLARIPHFGVALSRVRSGGKCYVYIAPAVGDVYKQHVCGDAVAGPIAVPIVAEVNLLVPHQSVLDNIVKNAPLKNLKAWAVAHASAKIRGQAAKELESLDVSKVPRGNGLDLRVITQRPLLGTQPDKGTQVVSISNQGSVVHAEATRNAETCYRKTGNLNFGIVAVAEESAGAVGYRQVHVEEKERDSPLYRPKVDYSQEMVREVLAAHYVLKPCHTSEAAPDYSQAAHEAMKSVKGASYLEEAVKVPKTQVVNTLMPGVQPPFQHQQASNGVMNLYTVGCRASRQNFELRKKSGLLAAFEDFSKEDFKTIADGVMAALMRYPGVKERMRKASAFARACDMLFVAEHMYKAVLHKEVGQDPGDIAESIDERVEKVGFSLDLAEIPEGLVSREVQKSQHKKPADTDVGRVLAGKSPNFDTLKEGQPVFAALPESTKIAWRGSAQSRCFSELIGYIFEPFVTFGAMKGVDSEFVAKTGAQKLERRLNEEKLKEYEAVEIDATAMDSTYSELNIALVRAFGEVCKFETGNEFASYVLQCIEKVKVYDVVNKGKFVIEYKLPSGVPFTLDLNSFSMLCYGVLEFDMDLIKEKDKPVTVRLKPQRNLITVLSCGDDNTSIVRPGSRPGHVLDGITYQLKITYPKNGVMVFCNHIIDAEGNAWPLLMRRMAAVAFKTYSHNAFKNKGTDLKHHVHHKEVVAQIQSVKDLMKRVDTIDDLAKCVAANRLVCPHQSEDELLFAAKFLKSFGNASASLMMKRMGKQRVVTPYPCM